MHSQAEPRSSVSVVICRCWGRRFVIRRVSRRLSVRQARVWDLLQVETGFSADKQTSQAVLQKDFMLIEGYGIHAGETTRSPQTKPFGRIMRRASDGVDVVDGAVRPDGSVWGTYLHGLFHHDEFRHSWLGELGWLATEGATLATPDDEYDRVADALETTVGWPTWEQFLFSPC